VRVRRDADGNGQRLLQHARQLQGEQPARAEPLARQHRAGLGQTRRRAATRRHQHGRQRWVIE